jgi:hypothetical protein
MGLLVNEAGIMSGYYCLRIIMVVSFFYLLLIVKFFNAFPSSGKNARFD